MPHPGTAYGRSKLKAEDYLKSMDGRFPISFFVPRAYMARVTGTTSS